MSNNTNTTTYNLIVPFGDKDIVKKHGAKWDSLNKIWYFIGDLPDEIQKYKGYAVHVEYEDKDLFKSTYKFLDINSARCDSTLSNDS